MAGKQHSSSERMNKCPWGAAETDEPVAEGEKEAGPEVGAENGEDEKKKQGQNDLEGDTNQCDMLSA